MESGSVRGMVILVTGGLRVVPFAPPFSTGVRLAVVPDSVTVYRAGKTLFLALLSVGLDASMNAIPFRNWMSSNPPPCGVFGSVISLAELAAGSMVKSRGLPSSLHITHSTFVVGFIRMPSVWQPVPAVGPPILHDLTSLPLVVYSPIVLDLSSAPSLAVMFCQPIHTLPPA